MHTCNKLFAAAFFAMFLLLTFVFSGCKAIQRFDRHFQSSVVGLNRIVTLYAADGKIIKQWRGKIMLEVNGGTVSWVDNEGKVINISGTYTAESY